MINAEGCQQFQVNSTFVFLEKQGRIHASDTLFHSLAFLLYIFVVTWQQYRMFESRQHKQTHIALHEEERDYQSKARCFATCLTQQTDFGFFKIGEPSPQPEYTKENPSSFVGL